MLYQHRIRIKHPYAFDHFLFAISISDCPTDQPRSRTVPILISLWSPIVYHLVPKKPATKTKRERRKMAPQSQTLGWIWPKDPRPGNPSSWPRRWRFHDVLTNKGPDIYVGVIGGSETGTGSSSPGGLTPSTTPSTRSKRSPQRTNWDRWEDVIPPKSNNIASSSPSSSSSSSWATTSISTSTSISGEGSPNSKSKPKIEVPWARRAADERYDYRQRKYTVPDLGTWSRVEYCTARGKGGWVRRKKGTEKHYVPRRYWDQNGNEYPANYWHDIIYGEHDDHESVDGE